MRRKTVFKLFKWMVGIILGIMLVISALLLVFKDDIKRYALKETNQYLNKKVHVSYIGIGIWKSFPQLSLSFDDVLVYSKFDTLQTGDTAIYAKKIVLRFNPMDFYRGKYRIQEIDINDANVNLKVLEDGRINYDFIKTKKDTVSSPFQFKLNEIHLENTRFSYVNEATQQSYYGYFHHLEFEGAFNKKQFLMQAKANFEIENIQSKSVSLIQHKKAKCNISIAINQQQQIFQIKKAHVSINHLPFQVRGEITEDSLHFFVGAKGLSLPDVANNFGFRALDEVQEVKGKGKVDFNLSINGEVGNRKSSPNIRAQFSVKQGSLVKEKLKVTQIKLEGKYVNLNNGRKEQLTLSNLRFFTLNQKFQGHIMIDDFNQPHIRGAAKGKVDLKMLYQLFGPFNLQKLEGIVSVDGHFNFRMNLPKTNPSNITLYNGKSHLQLQNMVVQLKQDSRLIKIPKGELNINDQEATITNLEVRINQSDIVLNGKIKHLSQYLNKKGNLLVDATIMSSNLHVLDLENQQNSGVKNRHWLLPDDIRGTIGLSLDKVSYKGHTYSSIKTNLSFLSHHLKFSHLEGMNAKAHIEGSLDIIENKPMLLQVNTSLHSDDVFFRPLFKEWKNFDQSVIKAANVKGKAKINLSFSAPFDLFNHRLNKKKINAKVNLSIDNGELLNVQAFKQIIASIKESKARLLLSSSTVAAFEHRLLHLKFKSFRNVFTINDGVITIPKMTIQSNALDLKVKGTHSFSNKINYHFDFRFRDLKGEEHSKFGDIIDDKTGFHVFLHLFGTINNPQFEWDKAASKKARDKRRLQAKEDFRSSLKTGFGIGKKDTTIDQLHQNPRKEDRVIMGFGNKKESKTTKEHQQQKERKGLGKKIHQWKQKEKQEKQNDQPIIELGN